jgi:adenylylsulfate kinase-like enzyme
MTKRRVQEQSNIDQTTGTSNTGKNVIAKAMMNALVKEYLDT